MHTGVISEELPDIHALKIPYLIPWAAGQGLTRHDYQPSFTFRVSINDGHVAPSCSNGRCARTTGRRAAREFDLGPQQSGRAEDDLDKLPAHAVEIVWFNQGDPLLENGIERLVQAGKQALVLVANGIDAQTVVQAMAKQERRLPIFAHWALIGNDFWGRNQALLKKVDLRFVQSILENDPGQHPKLARFLERYRQRYSLGAREPIPR